MCCYREESYGGSGKVRRSGPFGCSITPVGKLKTSNGNGGFHTSDVGICTNFRNKTGDERCGKVHQEGINLDATLKQLVEKMGRKLKVDPKSRRRLRSLNLL